MAKGYWIASVSVADPETYKKYVEGSAAAFKKYGAKFIARGGEITTLEGSPRARNVVIEFDSVETALACYKSPEYSAAKAHREPVAEADIFIMEGYTGPQPND
ncbi:MAG: DUF1330 domain-containing protein [Rhodobacteraceae bacterium]|nr:DUF1330 domain-containing protein [Paracoccaceae bacterium]